MRYIMVLLAFLASVTAIIAPANAQYSDRIKCESRNYQPNACPAYGAADVRLVERQGGECRQGADWFYDGRSINVRNGCRGIFGVIANYGNQGGNNGYPGGGYGNQGGGYANQVIRCESRDYQRNRCSIDTRNGVQLQRQLGNTPCVQGRNWGWDRGSVWVSNGCRGEFFAVGGNNNGGWNGDNGSIRVIECSSRNYRPERCNTPIRSSASIERVLGGECVLGRTWGWDRNGIWVNDGCRGRFRVY
jgi:hypothetical protein